jgi:hypothetical protein
MQRVRDKSGPRVVKAPELAEGASVLLDPGSEDNGSVRCRVCRKLVQALEDAYISTDTKGNDIVLHPACAIKVGLIW